VLQKGGSPVHHLDRDLAMQALVGRGIDHAHAAFAKLRSQPI
jgi:hypothetical protein